MAGIFISPILNLAILDLAILIFSFKLTHTCQDWFPPFAHKKLYPFILTQLDDGSHFELGHVGLRHCHLGFRHLVIFSQIHSKTLSLHSDSWLKLIQSDSNSLFLTQLNDGSHLEWFRHCHLGFRHLVTFSQIYWKTLSLHSTWWWQPSWILPSWIHTLPSWIQTPCYLLSDSLKNTLTPLWLWLKLIQSDSNSFIPT